jgi:hypothetical protein
MDIRRIAQNVVSIQAQGGTPADVDEYLRAEGLTGEQYQYELKQAAERGSEVKHDPLWGALAKVNQGLLFGYNDEVQGALQATADLAQGRGFNYRQRQAEQELADAAYERENPTASAFLRASGAALPVAAATLAGGPAAGVSTAQGSLRGQIAQSARMGAPYGAADALGNAPTTEKDTLTEAMGVAGQGGLIGATIGAAVPPLVELSQQLMRPAQSLGRYVQRVVGGEAAPAVEAVTPPPNLSGDTGQAGTGPVAGYRARQRALDAIESTGRTPLGVMEAVASGRSSGAPSAIVDVGGMPVQREVRGARTLPGPAGDLIDERLTGRAQGQLGRASGAIEEAIGVPPIAPGPALETLAGQRRDLANPLYEDFRAVGTVDDMNVLTNLQTRASVYAPLHEQARRTVARTEGREIPPLFDNGGLIRKPTAEDLDMIKVGADAVRYNNKRGAVEPANAMDARAMAALEQTMRGPDGFLPTVDRAIPEYAAAREVYSGHAAMMDAVEQGQKVLEMTPDDITAAIGQLDTEQERQLFRGSAVNAIQTRLQKAADKAEAANVLREIFGWGQGGKRRQLQALFNDDAAFARFEAWAQAELAAVQSRRFVQSGSQTADKLFEATDLAFDPVSAGMDAGQAGMGTAAWNLARRGWSGVSRGAEMRRELADQLTSTQGTQYADFLRELEGIRQGRLNRLLMSPATQTAAGVASAAGGGRDLIDLPF